MTEVYVGGNSSGKTFLLEKKFEKLKNITLDMESLDVVCLGYTVDRNVDFSDVSASDITDISDNLIDFLGNRKWKMDSSYYKAMYLWCVENQLNMLKSMFYDFFDVELDLNDTYLSDGHSSFLVMISELIFCKHNFLDVENILVLIDEVESYFHIIQQEKIIGFLQEKFDVKLVVSTHSISSIIMINEEVRICYIKDKEIFLEDIMVPGLRDSDVLLEEVLGKTTFSEELQDIINLVSSVLKNKYSDFSNIDSDIELIKNNLGSTLKYRDEFKLALKILEIIKEKNVKL